MATLRELIGYGSYDITYLVYAGITRTKTVYGSTEKEAKEKFREKYRQFKIISITKRT